MRFVSVTSLAEVEKIVSRALETGKPYGLDLETTGVNPWRDDIVGLSVAFSNEGAVYVPIGHMYGQPFAPEQALSILKPMLEKVPSYIFNLPFDSEFLYKKGITINEKSEDVSLLTYVNGTETINKLSLHAKTLLRLDLEDYSDFMARLDLPKGTHTIAEAPISAVTEYCGKDALATFMLWNLLYPSLKQDRVWQFERELLPITIAMRRNGVLIDREHFEKEAERLRQEQDNLEQLIWRQASEAIGEEVMINVQSRDQVAEILFDKMKLPITSRSKKTKAPSTSENALAQIKWDYPLVGNIINYRGINKLLTSYLNKFPGLIEEDGRIHTSFNQTGVVTGRYSSSDPNLQNIPNIQEWLVHNGEEHKIIVNTRNAFTVPEGWSWVDYDYSQIEARIAAGVTKEPILLNAFQEGVDFHTKTASLVFGVPVDSVTKNQRQMGKKLNFLLLYGGEAKRLYEELVKEMKVSYAECKRYRDLYYRAYPKMFYEAERIGKDAYMTHSVQTIFGRVIPVPNLGHKDKYFRMQGERQAYNGIIQGSAADVLKQAMIAVDKMIKKNYGFDNVRQLTTVHDSHGFEVSPDVPKYEFVRDCLQTFECHLEGFPTLPAAASIGARWGSLKEIKNVEELRDGEKVSVSVPESVGKTFILEMPSFEVVQRTTEELRELKNFITSKIGKNALIVRIGEKELIFSQSGITSEDRDRLILMTSGKFYEKPTEEELKKL